MGVREWLLGLLLACAGAGAVMHACILTLPAPHLNPPARSMPADVSFGSIGGAGVVSAAGAAAPRYALLAAPTPGKDNTGPRPGGPLVLG